MREEGKYIEKNGREDGRKKGKNAGKKVQGIKKRDVDKEERIEG